MWRVISLSWLLLALSGFFLTEANAETIPALNDSTTADVIDSIGEVFDPWMNSSYPNEKAACAARKARYSTTDVKGYSCSPAGRGLLRESATDYGTWTTSLSWSSDYSCPAGYTLSADKSTCYKPGTPYCPSGYTLSPDRQTCSRPDPPKPPECPPPDVMAITCNALEGKYQQKGMITPTMGPGCDTGGGNSQMQQCGAGCGMTTRQVVTPTAAYLAHVYTGAYCKPDGSVTDGSYVKTPPTNKVCPPGQVYGEVNDVPTCLNSRQEPGKQAPETTSPDSCPKGSVSLINVTTGKPMGCVDPADTSKPCPDGTYKVTQGGMTTCQGTAATPAPSSPPGSGGSSGHSGGPKPGSGGSTGGTGGTNPKPGDSSSPTPEKPSDKPCDEQFPAGLKWVCGLGDGLSGPDGNQGPTTENGGDISGMLDTSDFFGGGSCPAPHTVAVNVWLSTWNWQVDYDPLCRFILMMRPGVIAVSMLTALFIIFKRG